MIVNKSVAILPYTEIDGVRTFSDSTIKSLYARIKKEGNSDIFCDGVVRDEETFLYAMKHMGNHLWIIKYNREDAGIVWINNIEHRTARGHFCMFKTAYGSSSEIGAEAIRQVLDIRDSDGQQIINTIIGLTPMSNSLAIRGIRRTRAFEVGMLKDAVRLNDGSFSDALMTIFTLEVLNG